MASLNLPELQDLASEGGYATTTALSAFSAVLLLSATRAFLRNPRNWTGAGYELTAAELDDIDELVSEAENEIMSVAAPGAALPDYVFYQEIGSGADGGGMDAGSYNDRLMTVININRDSAASLDTGAFNVPSGDYWIFAFATGYRIGENAIRLVDVATETPVASITPVTVSTRFNERATTSQAEMWGEITLDVAEDYMLQHRPDRDRTVDAQGRAADWLDDNVYAGVFLTKVPS